MPLRDELETGRARWRRLTTYLKFEHAVVLVLTALISIIIVSAIWKLVRSAGPHTGERQCPGGDSVDPQSKTFTTLDDAAAKSAAAGVGKDRHIIVYCGGGISATVDLFLLHHRRRRGQGEPFGAFQ